MNYLQWESECQTQNHHFINGEKIRVFVKFFQAEIKLTCDVCQETEWCQVITKGGRVWCFSCRWLFDTERLVKKMADERKNSDEEIEEAIRKLSESKHVIFYE